MPQEETRESERHLRRAERIERARGPVRKQVVRVFPRDDVLRKLLKHPSSGGFRSTGSIEWPFDQFTKRRLRDGDVTIEQQAEPQGAESQPQTESPPQARASRQSTSETSKPPSS